MEQTMKTLVEAAQEGDQQAIAQLYEKTSKKAYYLAKQLLKDEDAAQDILQDSYVKVFANLHMLRQPENFQGWLDTIVVNKSKDYLRKKKPMLFSQLSSEEEPDQELDFEDERGTFRPEAQVDYRETKRLVQAMIDALPEEQRMAVVLRYLEDMPVKRIAQIMECSEGTVKSRLNYGRKAIKAQVLELEKKGTKLYCMPLIPFLYWMFRQQALSAVVPASVGAGLSAFTGGAAAGSAQASGTAGASSGSAGGAGQAAISSQGAASSAAQSVAAAAKAGAAKAGTAAAVKAGAAAAGHGIAVKAAAVAAAVCIGGGAAAGGVYLASNVSRTGRTEVSAEVEDVKEQTSLEESVTGEIAESSVDMGKEQVLAAVAQAARTENFIELSELFTSNFDLLYEISVNDFQGEYVLFDGENFLPEVEGEGLLLRTRSQLIHTSNREGEREDKTRYRLYGYYGNFVDGIPEGRLLAFRSSRFLDRTEPPIGISITRCLYRQGESQGTVTTQEYAKEDAWTVVTETTGDYIDSDSGYTGHYDITLDADYWEPDIFGASGDEESFWEYPEGALPDTLEFSLDVSEGMTEGLLENSDYYYGITEGELRIDDSVSATFKVLDSTGNYGMEDICIYEDIVYSAVFWSDRAFYQEEGTVPFEVSSDAENGAEKSVVQIAQPSYEGAEEVIQLMEQSGQTTLQANIGFDGIQKTEDGYLIPVQILVPIVFEQDPMEGKTEGDVINVTVSDVTGQTAEFEVNGGDSLEEFGLFWSSNDYEDGKWRAVTNNDYELAKEVYLGSMLLKKDAQIRVLKDWYTTDVESATIEEFVKADENCPWYTQEELGLKEPEQAEGYAFNPETNRVESAGLVWNYDYETVSARFEITLDEQGNIAAVTQNWHP